MVELTKKISLITENKEESMKKFVVFFTLICMLSLLAVSAFAYDKTESDWAITADMQEDGTVKFT